MAKSQQELLVQGQMKLVELSNQLKSASATNNFVDSPEYQEIIKTINEINMSISNIIYSMPEQKVFGGNIYIQEDEPSEPDAVWITTKINNLLK